MQEYFEYLMTPHSSRSKVERPKTVSLRFRAVGDLYIIHLYAGYTLNWVSQKKQKDLWYSRHPPSLTYQNYFIQHPD